MTCNPGFSAVFLAFSLKSVPLEKSSVSRVILPSRVDVYILTSLSSGLTS